MGNDWDIPSVAVWRECYRVLKPGGHVLSFGGTRSWDFISLGLRAAGFEKRDTIAEGHPALQWCYGQGFPKSLDIAKAIDKAGGESAQRQAIALRARRETQGLSREEVADLVGCTPASIRDWEEGRARTEGGPIEWIIPSPSYREKLDEALGYSKDLRQTTGKSLVRKGDGTVGALGFSGVLRDGGHSELARAHEGWGTALKPSWEPILVFRKPLEGTVTHTVLKHGTGGLNIDGCRVGTEVRQNQQKAPAENLNKLSRPGAGDSEGAKGLGAYGVGAKQASGGYQEVSGRWPPNMALTHHPDCKRVGTKVKVNTGNSGEFEHNSLIYGKFQKAVVRVHKDSDGTETVEAWECVDGCPVRALDEQSGVTVSKSGGTTTKDDTGGASRFFPSFEGQEPVDVPFRYVAKPSKTETSLKGEIVNDHPTKKPLELMRWLVRLVTPPGGTVLDPYCGSGTTLQAAREEGMGYVGIEKDKHAYDIATTRMGIVEQQMAEQEHQHGAWDLIMSDDFDED